MHSTMQPIAFKNDRAWSFLRVPDNFLRFINVDRPLSFSERFNDCSVLLNCWSSLIYNCPNAIDRHRRIYQWLNANET